MDSSLQFRKFIFAGDYDNALQHVPQNDKFTGDRNYFFGQICLKRDFRLVSLLFEVYKNHIDKSHYNIIFEKLITNDRPNNNRSYVSIVNFIWDRLSPQSQAKYNLDYQQKKNFTIFEMYCLKGYFKLIQWFFNNVDNLSSKICYYFQSVCFHSNFKLAQKIYTANQHYINQDCISTALHWSWATLNKDLILWLVSLLPPAKYIKHRLFELACQIGDLELLKLNNIVDSWEEGLTMALHHNQVHIADFFNRPEFKPYINLKHLVKNNYLNSLKWLVDNRPDRIDIHQANDKPFCLVCKYGHLELAQFLYSLGSVNIHTQDERPFRSAVIFNRLEVVHWLCSLGPINIQTHHDEIIPYLQHIPLGSFLVNKYGIKFESLWNRRFLQVRQKIGAPYIRSYCLPLPSSKFWADRKFIFINIPKNATCSILDSLPARDTLGHVLARDLPVRLYSKMKTVVRNPYSRAVSAYQFAVRGGFTDSWQYINLRTLYPTFEKWVLQGLKVEHTSPASVVNNDWWFEPFIAQFEYLIGLEEEIVLDYDNIGRFENLASDVKRIFDLDLQCHKNKGQIGDWRDYYKNPAVRNKIYELYKFDFYYFGYDRKI